MRRSSIAGLLMVMTMAAIPAVAGATTESGKGNPAEGLAQCKKVFQQGAGNSYFKWCFHHNGTLGYLEAPVNQVQLYGDQWAVCSGNYTTTHGYAQGFPGSVFQSGLNPPTFPNLTTTVHRTSDGQFEVKQVFSQNPAEKTIYITVTLRNLKPGAIGGVTFSRKVDLDMNNSPSGDLWIRSYASVLVAENNAVSLSGITWPYGRLSQIEDFPLTGDCLDTAVAAPVTGDYAGRVNYLLGSIPGGGQKTFKYRIAQL